MTSAAQVSANRSNAQKSTGPRTAEGKAVAARNAVRHGLLAKEVVVKGEDPGEFECYRGQMLAELAPAGPMEEMLAQRIVHLSWRLRRAERLQAAAFDKIENQTERTYPTLVPEDASWLLEQIAERGIQFTEPEGPPRGRKAVQDLNQERVLDRLLVYERRIESSLYRTMAELRLLRKEGGVPRVSSFKPEVSSGDPVLPTSNFPPATSDEPPEGGTPNGDGNESRQTNPIGDGSSVGGIPNDAAAQEESRQTKPIDVGSPDGPVLGGAEVWSDLAPGEVCQTKPIQEPGAMPSNASSQPVRVRKFPNTVNEMTYDSYLGRWV